MKFNGKGLLKYLLLSMFSWHWSFSDFEMKNASEIFVFSNNDWVPLIEFHSVIPGQVEM